MSNFGDHPTGFFGVSGFYNGVVTTSFRNEPTATLTRDYGASPTSTKTMSFGGWIKRAKTGFYQNLLSSTISMILSHLTNIWRRRLSWHKSTLTTNIETTISDASNTTPAKYIIV